MIEHESPIIYLPVSEYYSPRALGGSGKYLWISRNKQVFDVTKDGTIRTKTEGEAEVIVVDANNFFNGDVRKVSVSVPASISFLEGVRETAVGSTLCLAVNFNLIRLII